MTTKNTTKQAAKKTAKKVPKRQGNLKPGSRSVIAMTARQAFDVQEDSGNIETGVTFDQWRHDQVMAAVKRPGVSACDGVHYKPLMVHFLVLAGREDEALKYGLKTGRVKDHGPVDDTHEAREQWMALLKNEVLAHGALAATPAADVLHGDLAIWQAIQDGGGAIKEGYAVTIAAAKFGINRCRFERLVELLRADQLELLYYTVNNRIAAREGRGESKNRNKSQRTSAAKKARKDAADPGKMAPRLDAL